MNLISALLALSVSSAALAATGPLMTVRGAALTSDPLSTLSPAWKAARGEWRIEGGVLRGAEVPADQHAATYRQALTFQDGVIQFDVRLDGAKSISLSLNDAGGHIARLVLSPKGFQARKDDHDHAGPDRMLAFNRVTTPLAAGTWHTVTVELLGTRMLASVDGQAAPELVSFGLSELIGTPKTNVGLIVQGGAASFRNFGVWAATPNAAWTDPAPMPKAAK